MSRARDLARLGNENIISVDSNNNVGINSTVPEAQLDVVGVISATTFTGNVTGTVTGDATGLTGTPDIIVNNITGVAATFTGELTYEDVTSIDSIGVVTARSGVVVSSGSSIGIGTDDPNMDFHVESTIPSIVLEESDAAADNKVWTWKADSEELVWQAETDTYTPGSNLFKMTRANQQINTFEGHNSGTAWFVVDNANERVGIGTSSPGTALEVKNFGSGSGQVARFLRDNNGDTGLLSLRIDPDANNVEYRSTGSTPGNHLFTSNNTEIMRLTTSGNVGIGTTAPEETLTVYEQGTAALFRGSQYSVSAFTSTPRIRFGTDIAYDGYMELGAFNNLNNLDTKGRDFNLFSSSVDPILYVKHNTGRVGINTTSPATKLSVAGNVRVQNSTDETQYLTISYQGIDFQNTGAGSSTTATSHLLNDYEEGTFDPFATVGGSFTGETTSTARYTRIGNLVYCDLRVGWTGTTGVTDLRFNLPFAQAGTTGPSSGHTGLVFYSGTSIDNSAIAAHISKGAETVAFYTTDGGSFVSIDLDDVNGTYDWLVSFSYLVA